MHHLFVIPLTILGICFAFVGGLLIYFYLYRKWAHRYWRHHGIKGPKPDVFSGNMLAFTNKMLHCGWQEWSKQYGRVFGYYEGSIPVLVTSDPDLVQEVFVKKFSEFSGRKDYPLIPSPEDFEDLNLFIARGDRWKKMRTLCNPTFSALKLKQMKILMDGCVETLMGRLEQKRLEGDAFDIYDCIQGMTLDVIAETCFGISTSAQTNDNDSFLNLCREFFKAINFTPAAAPMFVASLLLPEGRSVLSKIHFALDAVRTRGDAILNPFAERVIQRRRETGDETRIDLLQLLMDRTSDKTTEESVLTEKELVSNVVLLLVAGYETTSTTLAYVIWLLVTNPEVQAKLQAEIDDNFDANGEYPSYDTVMKMHYLDLVIKETQRLYPVASVVTNRRALTNTTIGSNIKLKEGMCVQADVWTLHRDPDSWGPVDPEKFYPERFDPEIHRHRNPGCYLPFGLGPKNCIGMRFALLEVKLTLAVLLRKYTLLQTKETEVPLVLKENATVTPRNGVFVKLESRM